MKALLKTLSAVAVLATGITGAQAADTTWTFDGSNMTGSNSAGYGNAWTKTAGGSTVTIASWSDSKNGAGGLVKTAETNLYSGGFGAYGRHDNKHTIDNKDGTDMLLFDFNKAVSLTSLLLGWTNNDTDITIAGFDSLGGIDLSSWSTVATSAITGSIKSYSNVGVGSALDLSGNDTAARYWLIGAYNQMFDNQGWTTGNDSVKLLALTTDEPVDVPAPATALLMLLGLGLVGLRRRQK